MGGFPEDEAQATAVICLGALVARQARATKIIVKTPHEASGVPTMEANQAGLKATRQMVNMIADQNRVDGPEINAEVEIIEAEVHAVMRQVLKLGRGDIARGAVEAFRTGVMDIPFAPAAANLGKLTPVRDNHGAIRIYDAGRATGRMKFQVICDEWDLPVVAAPLSLFGQSGDDRYAAVDKMILKRVDALPHGLINNVPKKLGETGAKLAEYVGWLSQRIRSLRSDASYNPVLHIDVYGTVGLIFQNDPERIADYLATLEKRAAPFRLYIEGPADAGSKPGQIALLAAIRKALAARTSRVRIVADEWCNTYQDVVDFVDSGCCDMVQIKTPDLGGIHNTIDAVLYCKARGVEAYQGGTCNETDISARACLHAALATRPDRVLVKPGMGFDEGMTIVANEMNRVLAVLETRRAS